MIRSNMAALISDSTNKPSEEMILSYFENETQKRFIQLVDFITTDYKAKSDIAYSVCSGKPGWNIKYKKSGKAICTLYPETEHFTVLIVLNHEKMDLFELLKNEFGIYMNQLYEKCSVFNGTKWLMICVADDDILRDVKNLIAMKMKK